MPGLVPGISCGQLRRRMVGRVDGRIPGTSPGWSGHDVSGARRDIIGLSQTARRRRAGPGRFGNIFWAGFAGIKWD